MNSGGGSAIWSFALGALNDEKNLGHQCGYFIECYAGIIRKSLNTLYI